jgi:hypothetical protein
VSSAIPSSSSTAAHDPVVNCFPPLSADRAPESADFVVARRGTTLRSLLLSTAAHDPVLNCFPPLCPLQHATAIPLADARLGILSTPQMEGKDQEEGDH